MTNDDPLDAIDLETVTSPVLRRLIEEVRDERRARTPSYNRTYTRHIPDRRPGGYNRTYTRHMK